ncbi:MAG: cryptochrome/photolyase family protein [Pseudomonadota bacterium]
MTERLILILGDQLSPSIASLKEANPQADVIVMGELHDEATYVKHHKKKIIFLFSAMRHFAEARRKEGWTVDYARLDDGPPHKSFTSLIEAAVKKHKPTCIRIVEPGEWRVKEEIERWSERLNITVDILEDDRFIASHAEFNAWAAGRKSLTMEYFYREMRRKTGLLMDGDNPVEGRWNFDADNRKKAPSDYAPPARLKKRPDKITKDVIALVEERFTDHFGAATPFWFAVTPKDAEAALDHFINDALPTFGDYQDAMVAGERFMAHSLLSFYMNAGLLDPLHVCRRAEAAYAAGDAPINAVEGFIRQIIGWREFIRGVYWREGPDYTRRNFFKDNRPLPDFYWTGDTDMACIADTVNASHDEAYAHHIQRLMVTGVFALIAGIDPFDVHEWYLSVYADAYEWVEAPNVIGMALFADGGVVGTKPYAASGAYINRMSNYCKDCRYSVSKKTEDDACPFNALYWDFLIRNRSKLEKNQRLSRIYQNWARMKDDVKTAYRTRAADILTSLDRGEKL